MSAETKAGDWWRARQRGERLAAHELRCELCGEASEEPVCQACIEIRAEEASYEQARH